MVTIPRSEPVSLRHVPNGIRGRSVAAGYRRAAPYPQYWPTAVCAVFVLLLAATQTLACAFDMVKPEKTVIDRIVSSDVLVLARPDDENPFRFRAVDVLHGDAGADRIEQLVDSISRRKLLADPSAGVLFSRNAGETWERVMYVDDSVREILDVSLESRETWRDGMPESRVRFMEALQDHPDRFHRTLAVSELDKVPYERLREIDIRIPVAELRADLWTPEGYPYQAIRALLLGLAGTREARREIAEYIERVTDRDRANNLGAFSAALIEIEGVAAVERLRTGMLLDPAQPMDKVEQIVMAMSVHSALAGPELRAAIGAAMRDLVAARPSAGVLVARQFSLRSDWSQSAVLEPLVRTRQLASLADLLTVSVYVARSREENSWR